MVGFRELDLIGRSDVAMATAMTVKKLSDSDHRVYSATKPVNGEDVKDSKLTYHFSTVRPNNPATLRQLSDIRLCIML